MSCLSVETQLLTNPLVLSTNRIGGISAKVSLASSPLIMKLADITKHPLVKCSIVCSISEVANFLRITPTEIQWITDGVGVFYDVESNMDWIIVNA